MSKKHSNDTNIGDRNRDPPTCKTLNQPIMPLRGQKVELLNDKLVVHIETTGHKLLNLCYKNQPVICVY